MSKNQKKTRVGKLAAKAKPRAVTTRQVTEIDPNGVEVTHHRTVDTLGQMLDSGAITPGMLSAARDFQAAFTIACFDSMPRVNLSSVARSPSAAHHVGVARALDALGGHGSPAGSCVWHVVGMQTSVREWALRQGWGGRPVRQESAQGILVAAPPISACRSAGASLTPSPVTATISPAL
jgi:hypothetical protein